MEGQEDDTTSAVGISWTVYFTQVSSFIADCEKQYGICNQITVSMQLSASQCYLHFKHCLDNAWRFWTSIALLH